MTSPQLHVQLRTQLSQWVTPKDQRHLSGCAEIVAAVLQSQSGCLSHWLPFLSHRNCNARAHLERLSYFVHNDAIKAETFYDPLMRHCLQAFEGAAVVLTLDTSMLWDQFCLIQVCLAWGGRSLTLAGEVIEHGSATVGFKDYRPLLERAQALLPPGCKVTLLADRGFEHQELIRWLQHHQWSWAIRAKSDLLVTLASGRTRAVRDLLPPMNQAKLFHNVRVLEDIHCHLATARPDAAADGWAVLAQEPTSLHTFTEYGQRFGGIEPHFKDYKSAGFEVVRSRLRDAKALTCLFMLLDIAYLFAWMLGVAVVQQGQRLRLDWHSQRGLSFLQLGLRQLAALCYKGLALPRLKPLPCKSPPPASASKHKCLIQDIMLSFSKVTLVSV